MTWNEPSIISSHKHSYIRIIFMWPYRQAMNGIHLILLATSFWSWQKCMLISLYLIHFKCTKMNLKEYLSIGRNILEFFFVPLYTEFLSNFHEKCQVIAIYNTNVKYLSYSFCYNLFLSYADNNHIHTDKMKLFCLVKGVI